MEARLVVIRARLAQVERTSSNVRRSNVQPAGVRDFRMASDADRADVEPRAVPADSARGSALSSEQVHAHLIWRTARRPQSLTFHDTIPLSLLFRPSA
jgi:hypothetical protein